MIKENKISGYQNLDGAILPAYPFHYFPDSVKQLLNLSEESTNFPAEITGAGILAAVATSIGNSLSFSTPLPDFKAKAILWQCIIASRGGYKSPAINQTLAPLTTIARESNREYRQKIREWEATDNKKRPSEWASSIIDNSTLEGVLKALQLNPRGVLTHADELDGFIGNFGRYSGGNDIGGYNSLWNGFDVIYNRKNSSLSMYVENPFWCLIGGLQPTRLSDHFGGERIESGFFDRMQFVFPHSRDYKDLTGDTSNDLERLWAWYGEKIAGLYQQSRNGEEAYIRAEDPEHWLNYYNLFGRTKNGLSDTDPRRGLASKAQMIFARFSLVAHGLSVAFAGKGFLENITQDEVRLANELTLYHYQAGLYAYNLIQNSSVLDTLPEDKKILYDRLPDVEFSRSDVIDIHEAILSRSVNGYQLSERAIDRFLKNRTYFLKKSYGTYSKIF